MVHRASLLFYGYYMLEAMAMAGNYQGALDVIREYWGAMIDLGATSFWGRFRYQLDSECSPHRRTSTGREKKIFMVTVALIAM